MSISDEPSKTFELVLCVRDSQGKDTGKRKSYSSDSACKIWEIWSKYVSSFTRKNKKSKLPDKKEAETILKEIFKNDNSL